MTDQTNEVAEQPEVETPEVDYKAFYEQHKETVEKLPGLVTKNKELLAETKAAKEEKRKQAEIAEQAKLEHAQKNGEFEKLWKQAQEEKEKIQQELNKDRQERRSDKINLAALKLAGELAKGDTNKAELLSEFVAKTVSSLADEYGNIEQDVLTSVKQQFETDSKYTPLLGSNGSIGGGAPGSNKGVQVNSKEVGRQAFAKLSPEQQMKHINGGGTVTDN